MTARSLLVLGALGAAAALPAPALARHGADDATPHHRHAAHHHARGDAAARARARHRHHARHGARHGADDGARHAARETHHGW